MLSLLATTIIATGRASAVQSVGWGAKKAGTLFLGPLVKYARHNTLTAATPVRRGRAAVCARPRGPSVGVQRHC